MTVAFCEKYRPDTERPQLIQARSEPEGGMFSDLHEFNLRRARARILREVSGFSSNDQLARALDAYRLGKGDFADYLIREHAKAAGAAAVATFDRALLAEAGFTSP